MPKVTLAEDPSTEFHGAFALRLSGADAWWIRRVAPLLGELVGGAVCDLGIHGILQDVELLSSPRLEAD